jgi:hypothetical protein
MALARRRIDTVLDPEFVADVQAAAMSEVRDRRRTAEEEEVELSFVRRVLQGKLDLLQAELRVRAGEAHSLIESLPEVLADDGPRPQFGRLPRYMSPSDHPWGKRRGDELVTDDSLVRLDVMSEPEIEHLAMALRAQEREVSDLRRQLHKVIDTLQAELTRRYASGEASVDDLLGSPAD